MGSFVSLVPNVKRAQRGASWHSKMTVLRLQGLSEAHILGVYNMLMSAHHSIQKLMIGKYFSLYIVELQQPSILLGRVKVTEGDTCVMMIYVN